MKREPPRDVAVLIPGPVRVPIANALWHVCRQLEHEAERDTCGRRADRVDLLVEMLSKVAREVAP